MYVIHKLIGTGLAPQNQEPTIYFLNFCDRQGQLGSNGSWTILDQWGSPGPQELVANHTKHSTVPICSSHLRPPKIHLWVLDFQFCFPSKQARSSPPRSQLRHLRHLSGAAAVGTGAIGFKTDTEAQEAVMVGSSGCRSRCSWGQL